MADETKYFLTVDWCDKGRRVIFCSRKGNAFWRETEHTADEMGEILGLFELVLSPKSIAMTEEEVSRHTRLYPLEEYSDAFGVAIVPQELELNRDPADD